MYKKFVDDLQKVKIRAFGPSKKAAQLEGSKIFMKKIAIDNAVPTAAYEVFFEKEKELYFIYSTTPRYIVYKCSNFENLQFVKIIDIDFPLRKDVPNDEKYFTSYIGSNVKISTGGSINPVYIKEKEIYIQSDSKIPTFFEIAPN
jgi:hypothetical protein